MTEPSDAVKAFSKPASEARSVETLKQGSAVELRHATDMRAGQRRARIDDVAGRAGVSIKTVSRVLNGEPNISPETKEKVLASIRELRYIPNPEAKKLAHSKKK